MRQNMVVVYVCIEGLVREMMIPATEYNHLGKTYVHGLTGRRYEIHVTNLSGERIELVPSVDGLDVHDGQEASYEKRGLVVNASETAVFKGFRLDHDHVATFRFGGVEESYAAKIGKSRNIGVIGLAVFEERVAVVRPSVPPPIWPPYKYDLECERSDFFSPMRGGSAPKTLGGIGTVFGEKREDHVGTTTFIRATSAPVGVLSIRYEDRAGLEALGILVVPSELEQRETASPFPASERPFAKPPHGWRG